MHLPLSSLKAFEAAARLANFRRAAEELNRTHGAISHHVNQLELALEVQLFDRSSRALKLTPEGTYFLKAVQKSLDGVAEAAIRVRQSAVSGRLTVSAPVSFISSWLLRYIDEFHMRYPDLELSLLPQEPGSKESADEADISIRYGNGNWERRWVRLWKEVHVSPVCSPQFANRNSIRKPHDLAELPLVHIDDGMEFAQWLLANDVTGVPIGRGLRVGNAHLGITAALAGLGVALGDNVLAQEHLQMGRLFKPFGKTVKAPFDYYLVARLDRAETPLVKAFTEWLINRE